MKTALLKTASTAALIVTIASVAAAGIPNTFPQNVGFPSDYGTTKTDNGTKPAKD